jgi:hypothetical protein
MTDHGDLIITTSANTVDVPLSVKGAAALGAPSHVVGVPGDGKVALSFTPPAHPSVQITGYDVQQSTDGGQTWSSANVQVDSDGVPTSVAGLTNGQSYEFEVAGEDAWGDGPWSSPSAAVIPHTGIDTSALTAPAARSMKAGTVRFLNATLRDHDTSAPIAGARVTLTGGGKTTNTTTDGRGIARAKVHPTANTTYTWRYAKTKKHGAATTTETVAVEQAVRASLSHSRVKRGHSVVIFGTVSPNEKGKAVVVQELVNGAWKALPQHATIKSQLLPGGHHKVLGYAYPYTPTKSGKHSLRVSRAKTPKNAAGLSKRLLLTVT